MALILAQHWIRGVRAVLFTAVACFIAVLPASLLLGIATHVHAAFILKILALLWMLVGAPCVFYNMLKGFKLGFKDWFVADGEVTITEQHGTIAP